MGIIATPPRGLAVGTKLEIEEHRAPTFWEWLTRKRIVPYTAVYRIDRAVTSGSRSTVACELSAELLQSLPVTPCCLHPRRYARIPEFSVGDESDYISTCHDCGRPCRMEPNE